MKLAKQQGREDLGGDERKKFLSEDILWKISISNWNLPYIYLTKYKNFLKLILFIYFHFFPLS